MPEIFGSVPKATQKLLLIEAYKKKHDFFNSENYSNAFCKNNSIKVAIFSLLNVKNNA